MDRNNADVHYLNDKEKIEHYENKKHSSIR